MKVQEISVEQLFSISGIDSDSCFLGIPLTRNRLQTNVPSEILTSLSNRLVTVLKGN